MMPQIIILSFATHPDATLAFLHTLLTGIEIAAGGVGGIVVLTIGYKLFDGLFRGHHERCQLGEQTRLLAAQRKSFEEEQEHKRWLEAQQLLHRQQLEAERLDLERARVQLEREKLYLTTGLEREKTLIPEGNMLVWQEEAGPRVFANPRSPKQIALPMNEQQADEAVRGLLLPYPEPVDFADILASGWRPTPEQIFMFLTIHGALYDIMEETCHIALVAPTGGGKTTILRLLLPQFLYCGADLWLANPNFAPVKLNGRTIEDWRPIVRAMKRPVARKIESIKSIVDGTLTYLDNLREAQQQSPLRGNDVYLALGEWIAIQSRWKDAAEPVGMLFRESRQYGIHIISELHDALVKSTGLSSGLRKSFHNVYYLGGDPTTAKALLDLPSGNKVQIEEDSLGKKGTAIFRGKRGAIRGRVPFPSNRAAYMLLGEPENPLPDRLPEGADPVAFFRSYGLEVPQVAGSQGSQEKTRVYPVPENPLNSAQIPQNGPNLRQVGRDTGPLAQAPKSLVETAEATSDRLPDVFLPRGDDLVMSDLQVKIFKDHYEDCGNIEKSLARIRNERGQGLGGRYYHHASWIVKHYGLKKRG